MSFYGTMNWNVSCVNTVKNLPIFSAYSNRKYVKVYVWLVIKFFVGNTRLFRENKYRINFIKTRHIEYTLCLLYILYDVIKCIWSTMNVHKYHLEVLKFSAEKAHSVIFISFSETSRLYLWPYTVAYIQKLLSVINLIKN